MSDIRECGGEEAKRKKRKRRGMRSRRAREERTKKCAMPCCRVVRRLVRKSQ